MVHGSRAADIFDGHDCVSGSFDSSLLLYLSKTRLIASVGKPQID